MRPADYVINLVLSAVLFFAAWPRAAAHAMLAVCLFGFIGNLLQ